MLVAYDQSISRVILENRLRLKERLESNINIVLRSNRHCDYNYIYTEYILLQIVLKVLRVLSTIEYIEHIEYIVLMVLRVLSTIEHIKYIKYIVLRVLRILNTIEYIEYIEYLDFLFYIIVRDFLVDRYFVFNLIFRVIQILYIKIYLLFTINFHNTYLFLIDKIIRYIYLVKCS